MLIKRNQLVITALASLVAVAGYINFTGGANDSTLTGAEAMSTTSVGNVENASVEASEILSELNGETGDVNSNDADISSEPGEAILVNATGTYDYIVESKLEKEYMRAQMLEGLMNIVNNTELSAEEKKAAVDKYANITTVAEKELLCETTIKARGYENVVVTMIDDKADVILISKPLEINEVTRIQEIVKNNSGVKAENITITVVDATYVD